MLLEEDSFFIISVFDGNRIQGNPDGTIQMMPGNSNELSQKWAFNYGKTIYNVATGLPLEAGNGKNWVWNADLHKFYDARSMNNVMTKSWDTAPGNSISYWQDVNAPVQFWQVLPNDATIEGKQNPPAPLKKSPNPSCVSF